MADLITNLLDLVRVNGTAYFNKSVEAPWAMDIEEHQSLCRFHLVLTGSTWVGLTGKDYCEKLSEGDFVIVPRGQPHYLDDRPGRTLRTNHHVPDPILPPSFQRLDCGKDETNLLCGYFQFANGVPLAIISRLPDVLLVKSGEGRFSDKISQTVNLLKSELSDEVPASQVVLNRLTEILYFHAIRHWLDEATLPDGALNSLSDPKLQRVLDQIHEKPAFPWTVEDLARIAGQSRTAFSMFFKESVGLTPINYIAEWRTEVARKLLNESNLSLDEIAIQAGYNDTNAFSRAFKRASGTTPGAFRKMSRG